MLNPPGLSGEPTVQLAVVGQKLIFKTFSIHGLFLYLNPVYWLYLLIRRKETEVCYKENEFYTKMRQKKFSSAAYLILISVFFRTNKYTPACLR